MVNICAVINVQYTHSLCRPYHSLFAYFHRVDPCAGDGEVFMGFGSCVPHHGKCRRCSDSSKEREVDNVVSKLN
jgi:hypothetical protein